MRPATRPYARFRGLRPSWAHERSTSQCGRSLYTSIAVFRDDIRAVTGDLREFRPELRHAGQLDFLLLGDRPQLRHWFAAPFDHDDGPAGRIANQFRSVDMQVANGSLPHVLLGSTL